MRQLFLFTQNLQCCPSREFLSVIIKNIKSILRGIPVSDKVLVALISAASMLIVCLINNIFQSRKVIAEISKGNELQAYRINELDKKVEKHNQVIERVFQLEKQDEVEREQIKVINHRIDDLENFHK